MAKRIVPKEALDYFNTKSIEPSFDYRDVWRTEHNNAFTIAKMLDADLLADVKAMISEAIEGGVAYREFAGELEALLVRRGWWGVQLMVDPLTDEEYPVQLGSERRIRTIYKTNMRTARAAGQWDRIERSKEIMPYLIYDLGPSREHRDEHPKLRNTLLLVDDPWWGDYMPPNGWGCNCWVRQVSEYEAEQLRARDDIRTSAPNLGTTTWNNKRTGEVEVLPVGIEPGWNYNPGKDRQASYQTELAKKESNLSKTLSKPL
ncbi:hypothetical protein F9L16_15890 [Agarivorans sp. B2Z047]|uniref:phage head morphogenesis protein n=1 Tax=Agarivorans sp. B2Z047 TaxID=2652721 RepID=UPI00128B2AB5|nr:phage minor head protein [Agarivorans sp. B2Z047]MPW30468.1 hypothetical protein [Agarivorans sp. B2Z047]UQN42311.1 hypothetical protein LQZ07_21450 [Agarivorans sp. B2Z047]